MKRPISKNTQKVLDFVIQELKDNSGSITRKLLWIRYRASKNYDPKILNNSFSQILNVGMNRGLFHMKTVNEVKMVIL